LLGYSLLRRLGKGQRKKGKPSAAATQKQKNNTSGENAVKITSRKTAPVFVMTALAASISASMAMAQEAEDHFMLEEIVVTANKRESSLMETGLSISAYSSETMEKLGIDDVNDLSVNTPALSITTDDRITVRGVGQESGALGIDPGVATYSDGVYLRGTALYQSNNFYDMKRIEVLRGPQGTLYGRNTAGGAINLVRNKPQQEFEADLNFEAGNNGYLVTQGMVNLPINDQMAWRTSVSKVQRDPMQNNDAGRDIDSKDDTTFDTTLVVDFSDDWTADLRVFGFERSGIPESGYIPVEFNTTDRAYAGTINTNATFGSAPNPGVDDISNTSRDYDNHGDEDFTGITLTNTVTVGDIDVKVIAAHSVSTGDSAVDADRSSNTLSSVVYTKQYDVTIDTLEIQFISDFDGPMNFIGGLYGYQSKEQAYISFRNIADDLYATSVDFYSDTSMFSLVLDNQNHIDRDVLTTLTGNQVDQFVTFGTISDYVGQADNTYFYAQSELESESYAAFGQVDYDFSDELTMTLGLRYSYDKKAGAEEVYIAVPMTGDYFSPGVALISHTQDALNPTNSIGFLQNNQTNNAGADNWENVSGTARLEYSMEDGFVYGSISTGYRSGGFNLGAGKSSGLDDFGQETITSYEVGYKGMMLEQTLSLEVSAYYYDYQDLQVLQTFIADTGNQGNEINNAATASITGLEMQLAWRASERLTLSGGYAYTKAEYDSFVTIDTASFSDVEQQLGGNSLNRAPEHKVGLSAIYDIPLGDKGDLSLIGVYSWVDEMYTDVFNSELGKLEAWDRVDLRAIWRAPADNLSVSAFVKNLMDDREATDASRGTATDDFQRSEAVTDPRMYGVAVNYNF